MPSATGRISRPASRLRNGSRLARWLLVGALARGDPAAESGVVRHAAMQNPTLVVLTDRNDLDDQFFGQFQRRHDILGQMRCRRLTESN